MWKPAWYELDQSIKCGAIEDWWLVNNGPNNIRFHTGLDSKARLQIVNGEIISITHKALGSINEIDCHGLLYKIILASGQNIQVEAEEGSGTIEKDSSSFQEDFDVAGFNFQVEIKWMSKVAG